MLKTADYFAALPPEAQQALEAKARGYLKEERSNRASIGMRARAEGGTLPHCPPLGYRKGSVDGKATAVPDPVTGPLVAEALGMLAQRKASLRKVLAEMTAKGLRNRKGLPLSFSSFQAMAANPFYAGIVRYEGKEYPGSHEPLVSMELFQRIQGHLEERNRRGR